MSNVIPSAIKWVGAWRGWRVARNRCFRLWHVAAMAIVLIQALIGVLCPTSLPW